MPAWDITHNDHNDTFEVRDRATGRLKGQHPNEAAAQDQLDHLILSVPAVHRQP